MSNILFSSSTAWFRAILPSLPSFMSAFNIFYMTRMLEQCASTQLFDHIQIGWTLPPNNTDGVHTSGKCWKLFSLFIVTFNLIALFCLIKLKQMSSGCDLMGERIKRTTRNGVKSYLNFANRKKLEIFEFWHFLQNLRRIQPLLRATIWNDCKYIFQLESQTESKIESKTESKVESKTESKTKSKTKCSSERMQFANRATEVNVKQIDLVLKLMTF